MTTRRTSKSEPEHAIVVNEPSQAAANRAYAFMEEMEPIIATRRTEREEREGQSKSQEAA